MRRRFHNSRVYPVQLIAGLSQNSVRVLASFVLLITILALFSSSAWAGKTPSWPKRDFLPPIATINARLEANSVEDTLDSVDFNPTDSGKGPVLQKTPRVTRLDNALPIEDRDRETGGLATLRRKVEEADLEHLWQATVQKNPVIRFALEKLSAPADTQPKQSSRFLRRTLSTMISGATMASTMLPGGGAYRNMMSMAGGNAMQNVLAGNTSPTPGALSATEQIQLAGLIDDLKLSLIRNYQDYEITLQALAQSRETTARNSTIYTQAQNSHNDMAVMAASSAYFQSLLQETNLKQKARLQRLTLERIAGRDAVTQLALAPVISDTAIAGQTPEKQSSSTTTASLIGPQVPPIGTQPSRTTTVKATILAGKKPAATQTASIQGAGAGSPLLLSEPQAMLELSPNLHLPDETFGPMPPEPTSSGKLRIYRKANKNPSPSKKGDIPQLAPLADKILDNSTVSATSARQGNGN
jgi:hypothetical protein